MLAPDDRTMTGESPATFYAATAVPHETRPRLMREIDAHVCVVGGGFAGLWTARALARAGHAVVLLEGRTIAGEASGRNGGVVSAGFAERLPRLVERVGLDQARALYRLSRDGLETVRGKLAEGIPGLDPVPGRLNVRRVDDMDAVRREADLLGEQFDHEMLVWPTERVRETLRSTRYYQALHDADAFSIHPLNLALALAAEIESAGGQIFENTIAASADLDGVRKWIVTSAGRVRAHHVVFCGSAFIGEGFPALARTILPIASFICVTEPIAEPLAGSIRYSGAVMDTRRAGDYYRIVGDRLLWGGRMSTRMRAPRRLARLLARDIGRVYPRLAGAVIEHAWQGVMGYALHRMPQIGELRPGVWIASAFGGQGLNTTAMAGELIAAAIGEHDDRWRQFIPFGLVWAGGAWGPRIARFVHLGTQMRERLAETRSRARELRAAQGEAAKRRAEERAAKEKERAEQRAATLAIGEEVDPERRRQEVLAAEEALRAAEAAKRAEPVAEEVSETNTVEPELREAIELAAASEAPDAKEAEPAAEVTEPAKPETVIIAPAEAISPKPPIAEPTGAVAHEESHRERISPDAGEATAGAEPSDSERKRREILAAEEALRAAEEAERAKRYESSAVQDAETVADAPARGEESLSVAMGTAPLPQEPPDPERRRQEILAAEEALRAAEETERAKRKEAVPAAADTGVAADTKKES
jgi:glycine/D-amino acid oxidase-like deaminating enzyme